MVTSGGRWWSTGVDHGGSTATWDFMVTIGGASTNRSGRQ